MLIYVLSYLLVIIFVVFIEKSVRKIPLQHSQNTTQIKAGDVHHLPVKLNPSGVMPVIFAQIILTVPSTVVAFIGNQAAINFVNN